MFRRLFENALSKLQNVTISLHITSYEDVLVDADGGGTALQAGRLRVRFQLVSLGFFINVTLPAAL
jgi:hypothetical protein